MRKLVLAGTLLGLSTANAQEAELPYRPDLRIIEEVMLPPSRYGKVLFDLFEYDLAGDDRELIYDVEMWYGGDFNRVWLETEGEHSLRSGGGTVERLDLYYSRLIAPFWDIRIGAGTSKVYGDSSGERVYGVIGVQGLAPYWFETDLNLRIDTDGKLSADAEVEYDLLLTQRLILQPRAEALLSFGDVEEVGIHSGLNSVEVGLRLRYEIRRELAPYGGVSWSQLFGESADAARSAGEKAGSLAVVAGVRVWF